MRTGTGWYSKRLERVVTLPPLPSHFSSCLKRSFSFKNIICFYDPKINLTVFVFKVVFMKTSFRFFYCRNQKLDKSYFLQS